MERERAILVGQTFPGLRGKWSARGIDIAEVDLRWGVSEDQAARGETLAVCLDQVDRCRPFFLAMLGERYGWRLTDDNLSQSLAETFPVLRSASGKSLTEIELLHGFLADPNPEMRALVLVRRSDFLRSLSPEIRKEYEAESPEVAAKMAALKHQVQRSGVKLIEYDRPEDVDSIVASVLDGEIASLFPDATAASEEDVESGLHQAFAADRLGVHVGAEVALGALDHWVADANAPLMMVTGQAGAGKSALAANWTARAIPSKPGGAVFVHYLGVADHSSKIGNLTKRLQHHLRDGPRTEAELGRRRTADQNDSALQPVVLAGLDQARVDKPRQRITDQTCGLLQAAGARAVAAGGWFVVVLDGLDQATDPQDWHELISRIPAGVKLLATLRSDEAKHWRRHAWREIELPPLNKEAQERLIVGRLALMGKELSQRQKALLLSHHCSRLPLFLSSLLDELRWGATFNDLDERIADYLSAVDVPQFFAKKLERLEKFCGRAETEGLLRLIAASRSGIEERELLKIARETPLTWAKVSLGMGDELFRCGSRIAFSHNYVHEAVRDRYLRDPQTKHAVHLSLAEHYASQLPIMGRGPSRHGMFILDASKAKPDGDGVVRVTWPGQPVAWDIPWHLQQAGDWDRLEAFLTKLDRFQFLLSQGNENLASYWRALASCGRNPASSLHAAVNTQLSTHEQWTGSSLDTASDIANFLYSLAPQSDHTLQLWQDVLSATQRHFGAHHRRTRAVGAMVGAILRERGQFDAAQSVLASAHSELDASGDLTTLDRDQLHALHEQANLMFSRGDHAAAVQLERKVYDAVVSQRGVDDEDAIHTAVAFGMMLSADRKFEEADRLLADTLSRCARDGGTTSNEALGCRRAIGLSFFKQGRFAEAVAVVEPLLTDMREASGPSHSSTLEAMHNLGVLHWQLGDLVKARDLLTASFEGRKKTLGPDSRSTLGTLNELVAVCEDQGDASSAEQWLRELIAAYDRTRPPDDSATFELRWRLSDLLRNEGQHTRAVEWATETLEKHRSVKRHDDSDLIRSCVSMAVVLLESGDRKKAREVLGPALALASEALGETHDVTSAALFLNGRILIAEKEFVTAKARFEAALVDYTSQLGPDDPKVQKVRRTLAKAAIGLKDYDRAKSLLSAAHQALASKRGEGDQQTLDCLAELAAADEASGDPQTAAARYHEIVERSRATMGDDSETTALALNGLGRCYFDLREDAKAYDCFRGVVAWLERHFGRDDERTIGVVVDLAAAAQNSGRKDEARSLFERIAQWHERRGSSTHADAQLARRYLESRRPKHPLFAALTVVGRFVFGRRPQ